MTTLPASYMVEYPSSDNSSIAKNKMFFAAFEALLT